MATSTSTIQENKHNRQDSNDAICTGIDKHFDGPITFLQQTWKPADLKQVFVDDSAAADKTAAAKTVYAQCVSTEQTTVKKTKVIRKGLYAYLVAQFGPTSEVLLDFGFTPQKPRKTKPAVKAKAVVQTKATRKARSIMGKKQRKAIPSATTESSQSNGSSNGSSTAKQGPA